MNPQMQGAIDRRRIELLDRYKASVTTEIWGISGNCLNPWLCEGDAVWLDRTIADPVDGDLVVCEVWFKQHGLGGRSTRVPIMKQLQIRDGVRWLASADGWVRPRDAIYRGTIVGWHRVGDDRPAMSGMDFAEFA